MKGWELLDVGVITLLARCSVFGLDSNIAGVRIVFICGESRVFHTRRRHIHIYRERDREEWPELGEGHIVRRRDGPSYGMDSVMHR